MVKLLVTNLASQVPQAKVAHLAPNASQDGHTTMTREVMWESNVSLLCSLQCPPPTIKADLSQLQFCPKNLICSSKLPTSRWCSQTCVVIILSGMQEDKITNRRAFGFSTETQNPSTVFPLAFTKVSNSFKLQDQEDGMKIARRARTQKEFPSP